MQNDFMPGGALEVPDGDEVVPVVNDLLPKFDLVVATQDWHPEDHKSFASQHEGKEPLEVINLNGLEQTLWPDHCVQESEGARFHDDLNFKPIETIFRKGMDREIDSYSGFYDNDRRKSTGLEAYLNGKAGSDIYFAGLAAEVCVYYSMQDALEIGFNAFLIEDATRPLDQEDFNAAKEDILSRNGNIIVSDDIE
jgi:nicotinamidase/pyrazinamidase